MEGDGDHYFPSRQMSFFFFFFFSRVFLSFPLVYNFPKQVQETGEFVLKDGSDWDAHQMRELLYQDRSAHRYLDFRQSRV